MVVNPVSRHEHAAILAIEDFAGPRDPLIECRCQRDQLERRTWLVQGADRSIHSCFRFRIAGPVRIERGPVCQGEYLAGVRVHHEGRPRDSVRLRDRLVQFSFGEVLYLLVECEQNVRAGLQLGLAAVEPALPRVLHDYDFSALTANLSVQLVLDAAESFFVQIDKAQHMRCKIALRIESLVFLLEIDALQVQRGDRFCFFGRQLSRYPYKRARGFEACFELFLRLPYHSGKQPGGEMFINNLGRDPERGVHGNAHRQWFPIPVVDGAALGGYLDGSLLLTMSGAKISAMAEKWKVREPPEDRNHQK